MKPWAITDSYRKYLVLVSLYDYNEFSTIVEQYQSK